MKYFKKLVGENIYLSPRTTDPEDIEQFTKWLNDFETTDYVGGSGAIISLNGEKQYLEENQNNSNDICFLIIESKTDKFIGTVGIEKINDISRTGTLGIFIGDKEARNKGYGTEAINLLLDFAFNYRNLNNVILGLMEFNQRALACYKKCGFKEIGRRRKNNFINGKYYDSIYMDILAEEFNGNYIKNKNI